MGVGGQYGAGSQYGVWGQGLGGGVQIRWHSFDL